MVNIFAIISRYLHKHQMFEKLPGAAYDNKIFAKFSKNTIEKKAQNKQEFCCHHNLKCGKKDFLVAIIAELSDKNGGQVLQETLEGILKIGTFVAIRAIGSAKYQKTLQKFHKQYGKQIAIIADDELEVRKLLAAADASYFFNDGVDNEKLTVEALRYAALPIAPVSMKHIIENYDPNQESGNSFTYDTGNYWSAFAAVVRAMENFRFPYDWKNIQKTALRN